MDYIEILRQFALVAAASYMIGSIPTGYIIVKLFTGQDIRTVGSGSTGATNVKRVMGKKWFFIVMLLDALKGALPVALTAYFATAFAHIGILPVVSAICVILGHSKSVFLNFTGGKSVASGVGTIFALNWQAGLIIAAVWGIVTWISKYVSFRFNHCFSFITINYVVFKRSCCLYCICINCCNLCNLSAQRKY